LAQEIHPNLRAPSLGDVSPRTYLCISCIRHAQRPAACSLRLEVSWARRPSLLLSEFGITLPNALLSLPNELVFLAQRNFLLFPSVIFLLRFSLLGELVFTLPEPRNSTFILEFTP
jgi:hypothetical protein